MSAEDWTDEEWGEWFRTEVLASEEWKALHAGGNGLDRADEFNEAYGAMRTVGRWNMAGWPAGAIPANLRDWEFEFLRLSPEFRLKFFRGWSETWLGTDSEVTPNTEWSGARDEYYINVTLPDGSTVTEAAPRTDWSRWRPIYIGGFGVLGLITALGGYMIVTSGSDSSPPDSGEAAVVASDGTETSESGNSSSTNDSSSGESAAGESTADVDTNPCDAVREQQLVLELSSPDVQPTIPKSFSVAFVREDSYESPTLVWSEVPAEATEIAVLVLQLTDERAAIYLSDPNLWWSTELDGLPIGDASWTVTGLDLATRSLPRSSSANSMPSGVVERPMGGTRVSADGVDLSHRFLGPALPGENFMFTVFALCQPTTGEPDDYTAGWFRRHSVATGWFISESKW